MFTIVGTDQEFVFQPLQVELPPDQDLPETVRRYVEVSLQEWLAQRARDGEAQGNVELVFRAFLRWLDRNIETLVTEGLKQVHCHVLGSFAITI